MRFGLDSDGWGVVYPLSRVSARGNETMMNHLSTTTRQARPMIARMQPVSWLVIGLLVMFAGLAGLKISNRRERAAGQVGQPMSTMAVAMVDVSQQQQATRTPRPSATPRPTRTLRPTADATAAFFKRLDARQTIAVRTATAEARATQAIATFTPEPPTPTIYPVGYRAPWADKMVKQADGTWMAPKEVVLSVRANVEQFFEWEATGRTLDFVKSSASSRELTYRKYFVGGSLRSFIQTLDTREIDIVLNESARPQSRFLRVKSFDVTGLTAVCDVEVVGFSWDVLTVPGFALYANFREPDEIRTIEMAFDPESKRWKVLRYLIFGYRV
jgi:hypothetical protein